MSLSTFRTLLAEARWRGTWGTIRALKLNKFGTQKFLVGEDELGNKYFENTSETYGRDRWVEYSDEKNFDSSNISPKWHAWLHKMVDSTDAISANPAYGRAVTRNATGTSGAYFPSAHPSSAKFSGASSEKFEAWDPTQTPGRRAADTRSKDVLDLK